MAWRVAGAKILRAPAYPVPLKTGARKSFAPATRCCESSDLFCGTISASNSRSNHTSEFLSSFLFYGLAITITVIGLHLAYRLSGSDFGFEGVVKQIVIVLLITATQAGIAAGVTSLDLPDQSITARLALIAPLIATYVFYKFTHFDSMSDFDIFILVSVNFGLIFLFRFLLNVYLVNPSTGPQ